MCRTECALDKEGGVRGVVDHVDVLVVKFAHDTVDAATLHADTRSNGVDAVVVALSGNLCTLARDAGNAAQTDKAVGNLGDFGLEQTLQECRTGATQEDFRVSVGIVHAVDDGAHGVSLMEEVAGNLLTLRQQQLVVLIVNEKRLVLPSLIDFGRDNLAHAILVFVVERVVFEFEHFARQRLAERQDGAAAKLSKLDGLTHFFAHFVIFVDFVGCAERNLFVVVGHFAVGHDFAITIDLAVAFVGVDNHVEVFI